MALILLFSLFVVVAAQTQEKSICVKLEGLESIPLCSDEAARTINATGHGRPGKRGPIGEKGEKGSKGVQGSKGEIGVANYDRVEEMVSRRIQEVLNDQARKNSELSRRLLEADETIKELKNRTNFCPMRYNGKCFWIEKRQIEITCSQARDICAVQGAAPANIYSVEHHDMLIGYMRMVAAQDGAMTAWLGMTYDSRTSTVLLTDGSKAPYLKWFPGYPSSSACCCTGLVARIDWKSPHQHLHTFPTNNSRRGVICEK